jgi:hypothetical protein
LADPTGKFAEAMDLAFDGTTIFGNTRSKRYALLIENGKVKETFVEPDNTGVNGKSNALWSRIPLRSLLLRMFTDLLNAASTAQKVLG